MPRSEEETVNFGILKTLEKSGAGEAAPTPEYKPAPSRPVIQAKEEVLQISVRAPKSTIDRLKRLCHDERYSYGEMLARLLDAYEARQ